MSAAGTAREALIAEVIGDLALLLNRAEALPPALLESTQSLIAAEARLSRQLTNSEIRIDELTEKAKVQAVKHILVRTDEAARRLLDAQTRAMTDAAQKLFNSELTPALQRLAMPLQRLVERLERPWETWLTHAATAAVVSVINWTLAAYLWVR